MSIIDGTSHTHVFSLVNRQNAVDAHQAKHTRTSAPNTLLASRFFLLLFRCPPLQLLPQGSDFSGAGSLAALLATPEVLEAAAVLALLAGTAAWAVNFAAGTVGALLPLGRQGDSSQEEEFDEFEE